MKTVNIYRFRFAVINISVLLCMNMIFKSTHGLYRHLHPEGSGTNVVNFYWRSGNLYSIIFFGVFILTFLVKDHIIPFIEAVANSALIFWVLFFVAALITAFIPDLKYWGEVY